MNRWLIPVEHIQHDAEAVFAQSSVRNMSQQRIPNPFPAKLLPHVQVLKEQTTSLKGRITVEEEGVPSRMSTPFGQECAEFRSRPKSISNQCLIGYADGKALVLRHFINQRS